MPGRTGNRAGAPLPEDGEVPDEEVPDEEVPDEEVPDEEDVPGPPEPPQDGREPGGADARGSITQ
ncbi:hypothetical protein [Streptomyces mutabilis]|uniref:hypothetical protein n=1 Tax=Streptomyces mutabilis TaxID=67332 RepID=UPI00368C0D54